MADDTRENEAGPAEQAERPAKGKAAGTPNGPSRLGRAALAAALVLLAVVVAAQVAGILLRDRLEGRQPLLAQAPPPETVEPGKTVAVQPGLEPSGFGPEIQEVNVARPGAGPAEPQPDPHPQPTDAAPAPAPPPAQAQEKTAPAADVAAKKDSLRKETSARAAPQSPAVAAGATHALLVDSFLSQKYLGETEARLKDLGVPVLRTEISRKGTGFKVAVSAKDAAERDKARKALEARGLAYRAAAGGLDVYLYFREEAQELVEHLAKSGLRGDAAAVSGARPYWKVYAGPFPKDEAKKAQEKLAAAGIKTTLQVRP